MTFDPTYVLSFVKGVQMVLKPAVPILIAIGLVLFLWGLVKFLRTQSDDEKKKGRSFIIWGIVILVVMVSVWGIVKIVQGTIGVDGTETITSPSLPS